MPVNRSVQSFSPVKPMSEVLEVVFADCFFDSHNTLLMGEGEEPVYLPSNHTSGRACEPHRLVYREDFFSSALHETAHWCIAGDRRRTLVDFGYWYVPDGRDGVQQRSFEAVEIKPQALEWIFSEAAGIRFGVSVDNLNTLSALGEVDEKGIEAFRLAVWLQVREYCAEGLPARAEKFAKEVARVFGSGDILDSSRYALEAKEFNFC